jgi:hypothetical protein
MYNSNYFNCKSYCDYCRRKYKKNTYPNFVIITKIDLRLCINCYKYRHIYLNFKSNNPLINFLKKREIGIN